MGPGMSSSWGLGSCRNESLDGSDWFTVADPGVMLAVTGTGVAVWRGAVFSVLTAPEYDCGDARESIDKGDLCSNLFCFGGMARTG